MHVHEAERYSAWSMQEHQTEEGDDVEEEEEGQKKERGEEGTISTVLW